MRKRFKIEGMSYEEYQEKKHEQTVKAVMEALGWKPEQFKMR